MVLDPTEEEERQLNGMVLVATLPSLNEVSHVIQAGELEAEQAIDTIDLCVDACAQIQNVFQQILIKNIEKVDDAEMNYS